MADILFDPIPVADTTVFARALAAAEPGGLARFLPNRNVNAISSQVARVSRVTRAAQVRAFDAETPIGRRPLSVARSSVDLVPIGEKLPLGERQILMEYLQNQNSDAALDQVRAEVYNDVANTVGAVTNKVEQLRGEFLFSGAISLDENGFIQEADFGLDPSHDLGPGDLSDGAWDAGGDWVTDLTAWVQLVAADSGSQVEAVVVSTAVRNALVRNVREAYAGANALTGALFQEIWSDSGLPELVVYDGQVGGVRNTPANKIALVTAEVGETQWGLTAEGLELIGSNAVDTAVTAPPALVTSVWRRPDPVGIWTKTNATALPVAGDINGLLVAEVLAGGGAS